MSEHLRSAEDVAWEALSSDDYVLTPHEVLSDLIRAYAAEVREAARAEALAGFEWEESGEVGPCVNPDHATAHVAPGAKWSGPTCQHYVEVARRRLVGPPERIPEDES